MPDSLRLAEIVCSRLGHDIAGPLGTLTGALELAVAQRGGVALTAAFEAGEELARRVRLLRAAWGAEGLRLDLARLRDLARGLPGLNRIRIDLTDIPRGTVFDPPMGRMLLNALLLAAESLPRGGAVALAGPTDGDVLVTIAGARAAWPAGLAACLADPETAWAALDGPRSVLVPWIALLAGRAGVRMSLLVPVGNARLAGPPPLLLRPLPPAVPG